MTMTTDTLVASGTIRRRFARTEEHLTEVLAALASIASQEQFDPALVWTAQRLADMETGLGPQQRLLVALAATALLVAFGEGSTRLPLGAIEGLEGVVARLQKRLETEAEEAEAAQTEALRQAATAIASAREDGGLGKLLTPKTLPTLLGGMGGLDGAREPAYRPLILHEDGDQRALTSEKMLRKELELARAFANRMHGDADVATGASADATAPSRGDRPPRYPDDDVDAAVRALAERPTRYEDGKQWRPQAPNYEQACAILSGATRPLTLITGGPGTGKTSIVVSLLRLLVRLGVDPLTIALAAPTGKAAFRMRESVDQQLDSLRRDGHGQNDLALPESDRRLRERLPEARTLHRLLEYSPYLDSFRRDAGHRLDARVVICDEASMIDLDLMHALLQALPPHARLILVGDAHQLPSIGGGAVFRDIVSSRMVVPEAWHEHIARLSGDSESEHSSLAGSAASDEPTAEYCVRLEHSYRMDAEDADGGRQVLELARAVQAAAEADDPELGQRLGTPISLAAREEFQGSARLDPTTKLGDLIDRWFREFIGVWSQEESAHPWCYRDEDRDREGDAFQLTDGEFEPASTRDLHRIFVHYGKTRILCITQVFHTGAQGINRQMHGLHVAAAFYGGDDKFTHLEPVMVLQNNYDLGLFNGDQGVVADIRDGEGSDPSRHVVFRRPDGRFRSIPLGLIQHQLTHAYATSVHKSQGSEFAHVALVLPRKQMPLLTKEILYTGITRASKSVTIFDPSGLFAAGAASPTQRFTGLSEHLQALM